MRSTTIAISFPFFTVLVYLPGQLYFSNIDDFTLRLEDVLLLLLPTFIIAIICCVGLALLLPQASRTRLVSFALAIGILLWFQGNVLLWQYGPLDGSSIRWDMYWQNGLIDTPIWIAVLAFSLFSPTIFSNGARFAAVAIIGLQSFLLVFSAIEMQSKTEEPRARNYVVDQSPKYAFSDKRNVILIVLDAFQSDVFFEIVMNEPDYRRIFEGFTYFRNALSGSNKTELAIPALLTGKIYDNSQPRMSFLRDAFLEHGIMSTLKRSGFVVDIYPWIGWGNESIYFDDRVASNLRKIDERGSSGTTFTETKIKEVLHLLDLSVYRAVPHFLKQHVYNDQKWFILPIVSYFAPDNVKQLVSTDNEFDISTFLARSPTVLSIDRGSNVFKYFHFKGLHSPLTVDTSLTFTGDTFPFTRENYAAQAKANLLHLDRFFDKLKGVGIYDKSLVVIVGDHGSGMINEMYIESQTNHTKPYKPAGTKRNFRKDKARGIPLVLIKRFDTTGPLTVSESPVSLLDVSGTILSELNLELNEGIRGPSMFELNPGTARNRYYGAIYFNVIKSDYVGPITMYRVSGHSWLDSSWSVDAIYVPFGTDSETDASIGTP